jgi:uncharacterized membrane protein
MKALIVVALLGALFGLLLMPGAYNLTALDYASGMAVVAALAVVAWGVLLGALYLLRELFRTIARL